MDRPFAMNMTTVQRSSAPKVLLSTRAQIDKLDAGLTGIPGAREVIAMIQSRRAVTKLVLGHNDLGDDGCKELFRYLCSEDGRRFKISEISLNSNGIGDKGFLSISEYLRNNQHLRELFLQNNSFEGEPDVVDIFTNALNSSRLRLLSLVTNQQLSDSFFYRFISNLDSPYLEELQLSALGLTSVSGPVITEYLVSPRSLALETLKLNGNNLGLRAMRSIVRAVRRSNFTLLKLEVYSNFLTQQDGSSVTEDDEDAGNTIIWQECERDLKSSLLRNELLRRRTADAALSLLPYARALLFRSPRPRIPSKEKQLQLRSASKPLPTPSPFHFRALPLEIQHHILSFLAPIVSPSQLVRIFNYAASPSTLRPVLPKLSHSGGCIPDPSSLPFGISRPMRACASGRCMGSGGSLVCHRIEERMRWLQEVGCSRFEMIEGTDVDALLSL